MNKVKEVLSNIYRGVKESLPSRYSEAGGNPFPPGKRPHGYHISGKKGNRGFLEPLRALLQNPPLKIRGARGVTKRREHAGGTEQS